MLSEDLHGKDFSSKDRSSESAIFVILSCVGRNREQPVRTFTKSVTFAEKCQLETPLFGILVVNLKMEFDHAVGSIIVLIENRGQSTRYKWKLLLREQVSSLGERIIVHNLSVVPDMIILAKTVGTSFFGEGWRALGDCWYKESGQV